MAIAKSLAATGKRLTEEEFLRLPNDGKYELVDGKAKKGLANMRHGVIAARLVFLLFPHTRGRGVLGCGKAGFRMKNGNIRCPDVSFMLKSRFPDEKPSKGFPDSAPNLCIEIISPSETKQDMEDKLREYFESGAEQVWHLFPETTTLRVFTSPTESSDYAPDQEITGGSLLPDFRCFVADLFALE